MDVVSEEKDEESKNTEKIKVEFFERKICSPPIDEVEAFLVKLILKHRKKRGS